MNVFIVTVCRDLQQCAFFRLYYSHWLFGGKKNKKGENAHDYIDKLIDYYLKLLKFTSE